MAWYEFVIFFSLAFVGVVLVVYFGNRFYTGRKRSSPDVELDTGQEAAAAARRRRGRRDSPSCAADSNTTSRNPEGSENQEIIFTIANSRVGQATMILNREKLTDAQRVGNDPPPAYDSIVQGSRN